MCVGFVQSLAAHISWLSTNTPWVLELLSASLLEARLSWACFLCLCCLSQWPCQAHVLSPQVYFQAGFSLALEQKYLLLNSPPPPTQHACCPPWLMVHSPSPPAAQPSTWGHPDLLMFSFMTLSSPPFFFFVFLGPLSWHMGHMEVSRLGVKLELQPMTYTTAKAMLDLSHICELHHSSWQC